MGEEKVNEKVNENEACLDGQDAEYVKNQIRETLLEQKRLEVRRDNYFYNLLGIILTIGILGIIAILSKEPYASLLTAGSLGFLILWTKQRLKDHYAMEIVEKQRVLRLISYVVNYPLILIGGTMLIKACIKDVQISYLLAFSVGFLADGIWRKLN